jgi:hypothetical protein
MRHILRDDGAERIADTAADVGMTNGRTATSDVKGGYTLVTLPHIVTPYRESVDGNCDRVTYQKLVT